MSGRFFYRFAVGAFLTLGGATWARAQSTSPASPGTGAPNESRPRLIVLIVIDQLRADYLSRFEADFSDDGFQRLKRDGAWFTNANYSYAPTATGPGHASIATGRLPRQHGISANQWYQKAGAEQPQGAVWDDGVKPVSAIEAKGSAGGSPHNLIGPALGDEMKLADRRSRVFSVAVKDRAAVFMGGKRPDGVYWFNTSAGQFISSTYYRTDLPAYVFGFEAEHWPVKEFAGKSWERLLPETAYAGCYPIPAEWVPQVPGAAAALPIKLPDPNSSTKDFYTAIEASPFGNELVLEMARRILDAEKLGTGSAPDMLCIGLSSFDIAGHAYGPQSEQMLDMIARTDRQLGAFFKLLDEKVGLQKWLLALTADHGVTPISYVAKEVNLAGGVLDFEKLRLDLSAALRAEFGPTIGQADLIRPVTIPWLDFRPEFDQLAADMQKQIYHAATEYLLKIPGIAGVTTAAELKGAAPANNAELLRLWRGYFPGHSGHIYVHLAPYWYEKSVDLAGHSFGDSYDRHVPILLCGPGVKQGRYAAPADPLDIAPTLANLLGIEPPLEYAGRVLNEALR